LETVRFRTIRLHEELKAADRQARLSPQLTLLGQFTAGFMHEFNNPLAIVAGRIKVLLEERKEDAALCADLEQMLKEMRYMSQIATRSCRCCGGSGAARSLEVWALRPLPICSASPSATPSNGSTSSW
jgi:signal transduction histidine kinase